MDVCIESILACGDDIEILIVNDGSTKDNTRQKADEWQAKHPDIIRAIHKENGGHGSAVNAGLAASEGLYFKVVDSDDWLDTDAMIRIMKYLRRQTECKEPTDLVVANYVYEKVHEGKRTVMSYGNVFPEEQDFSWDDIGHFGQSQYLLMHSVIYRTELLKGMNLQLPEHCFYVDNIFVYVPLPQVKTIYYLNADVYRYFIGREDQSVNEKVMLSRIDQQLRVTRTMIDAVDLPGAIASKKLVSYMENYLSMMMCICSVFLRMENTEEAEAKRKEIWDYLEKKDEALYKRVRRGLLNMSTNIPTEFGRRLGLSGYKLAQKIFKFN